MWKIDLRFISHYFHSKWEGSRTNKFFYIFTNLMESF